MGDAAGVDDGDVSAGFDLAMTIGKQPLPDQLRVGVRDLAAEKANRKGRHAGMLLPSEQIGGPAGFTHPLDVAIPVECGRIRDEVTGRNERTAVEPRSDGLDERT